MIVIVIWVQLWAPIPWGPHCTAYLDISLVWLKHDEVYFSANYRDSFVLISTCIPEFSSFMAHIFLNSFLILNIYLSACYYILNWFW